jgi:hypothetical protein
MPRTVYIIGAGFSYPAGIPIQAGLLERVRDLGVLNAPAAAVDSFFEAQATSLDFITAISRSKVAPPLEDAFTLLDQTIATRGFCLGYTWHQLVEVREQLQRALVVVLHDACRAVRKPDFYRDVVTHLLARGVDVDETNRASVLSLNWDSVIEDAAFDVIRVLAAEGIFDVNFGCDTAALTSPSAHSPSLTQTARGVRNLNVLKLHGSINWLRCPNCQTLYSSAGIIDPLWDWFFGKTSCPNCTSTTIATAAAPLQPFLITPTFLKVFDSSHIQTTWQRAHHELALADEVVFVGYSLPIADFHLRALLRRAVRTDARITAVLTPSDCSTTATPASAKPHLAATRYEEFFGSPLTIHDGGVEGYFAEVFASLPAATSRDALVRIVASR